jgi:hypothetical protein
MFLFSAGSSGLNAQDANTALVRQIRNTIDSAYTYFGYDIRLQNRISAVYDSLFDRLADRLRQNPLSATNETTVDGKILAIADYKSKHNGLFVEISNKYIYGKTNPTNVAPGSPPLQAVHASPAYRLVWEYFLLKPPTAKMSDKHDIRISEALSKINEPASLPAIEKQYQSTTKTKIPLDASIVLKQKLSLLTVGKMPSEAGVRTLISMINQPIQRDTSGKIKWQPKDFVKDMLDGKEHLKTENQWKAAGKQLGRRPMDAATGKQLRDLKLID